MIIGTNEFLPALYDAIERNNYRRISELYDHYNDTPSLRAIAPVEATHELFGAWFDANRRQQEADRALSKCTVMLASYKNPASLNETT